MKSSYPLSFVLGCYTWGELLETLPKRLLRCVACVALVFFTWAALEPWKLAHAQDAPPGQGNTTQSLQQPSQGSAKKFEHTLQALKQKITKIDQTAEIDKADSDLASVEADSQAIEALDAEILANFQATGDKIKAAGLPDEILERHRKAVNNYKADYKELLKNLQSLKQVHQELNEAKQKKDETAATAKRQELKQKVQDLKTYLADKVKEPPHTPIDPNNLPHRAAKPTKRAPRLKKEEFTELQQPIQLAFNGDLSSLQLAQANPDLPTPEDLAETVEVQFTQEIQDLAAQLEHNPVKIYNFVRNTIDFVPTYGSIQGAHMCLQTKQCNDMDTASLLIALLRTSGISARYVFGTIEVPIAKVMNWVGGFANASAALRFVASAGTPIIGVVGGNDLVAARMEHIWVEAYVDFIPSRGAAHKTGDTWVSLDASFKQFDFTNGLNVSGLSLPNPQSVLDELQTSAIVDDAGYSITGVDTITLQEKVQVLESQISQLLPTEGNVGIESFLRTRNIITEASPILPASLPYHLTVRGATFPAAPAALRHTLSIDVVSNQSQVTSDLSYNAPLSSLAGKRITLSYIPASMVDEQTLASLLPGPISEQISLQDLPDSIPAYLFTVKAELRIEGEVVGTGQPVSLGQAGTLQLTFDEPIFGQTRIQNSVTTGSYIALVLHLGKIGDTGTRRHEIETNLSKIEVGDFTGLTNDEFIGEFLHNAGLLYWSELDLLGAVAAHVNQVIAARLTSEGVFGVAPVITSLFGIPVAMSSGTLFTDVDADFEVAVSSNNEEQKAINYLSATGMLSSRAEAAIYDKILNAVPTGQGFTAASSLEFANRENIPIFSISNGNVAAVLPQLSLPQQTKTDINNFINQGQIVVVPETELLMDGVFGIGYVALDAGSGSAAYPINTGLAGAEFRATLGSLGSILLLLSRQGGPIFAPLGGLALTLVTFVDTADSISKKPNLSDEEKEFLINYFAIVTTIVLLASLLIPLLLSFAFGLTSGVFAGLYLIALAMEVAVVFDNLNKLLPPTPQDLLCRAKGNCSNGL